MMCRQPAAVFFYALGPANDYIRCGHGTKVPLVIGAETLSRSIDWTDQIPVFFLAMAPELLLVAKSADDAGILSCHLHSDGNYLELLPARFWC